MSPIIAFTLKKYITMMDSQKEVRFSHNQFCNILKLLRPKFNHFPTFCESVNYHLRCKKEYIL